MICSEEHLIRMFPFITGITLSEYNRRRKITLAGYEILKGNTRVLDIALKFGYESQTSFTRTFKNYHGVTPSQIRKGLGAIKAYPQMKSKLEIGGKDVISVRTESTNPFQLFGYGEIELKNSHYHSYEIIINYGNEIVESKWHEKINKEAGFYKNESKDFHLLHSFIFRVFVYAGICSNPVSRLTNFLRNLEKLRSLRIFHFMSFEYP